MAVRLGGNLIVQGATLELSAATVTALVGPNGSGKSTLLRALSRLIPMESGTESLPGVPDARVLSARDFATRVSLLSQQRPTPAGITVRDLVEYGRHPYRRGWRGLDPDGAEAVDRAIELTGLGPHAGANLETLSGGQLQRAWFASALAQDTDVLLLDEPTNHLDLRFQVEILDLIDQLAREHRVAVGVVLHELNQAADVADRVVVLSEGEIVADAPPQQALDPELLSRVYEIPVFVATDPATGRLEIGAERTVRRRRETSPAAL